MDYLDFASVIVVIGMIIGYFYTKQTVRNLEKAFPTPWNDPDYFD